MWFQGREIHSALEEFISWGGWSTRQKTYDLSKIRLKFCAALYMDITVTCEFVSVVTLYTTWAVSPTSWWVLMLASATNPITAPCPRSFWRTTCFPKPSATSRAQTLRCQVCSSAEEIQHTFSKQLYICRVCFELDWVHDFSK